MICVEIDFDPSRLLFYILQALMSTELKANKILDESYLKANHQDSGIN